jgi:hypothetical protein
MNSNPWLHIPLEDYVRHMSHHLVAQSTLLNTLTKKYLDEITRSRHFSGHCRWKRIGKEKNMLPNGKSIITCHFVLVI